MSKSSRSLVRGLLAGAVGGALGTVVLTVFQKASLEGTRLAEEKLGTDHRFTREQEGLAQQFEQAHIQTAQKTATAVGTQLPAEHQKSAAPVVEFAFGIACAAVYGALAEYVPAVTQGFGTVYGATLFAGASEVVLPALGWVPSPADRTPVQHGGGLAGNVVYGAVTEAVRRAFRS